MNDRRVIYPLSLSVLAALFALIVNVEAASNSATDNTSAQPASVADAGAPATVLSVESWNVHAEPGWNGPIRDAYSAAFPGNSVDFVPSEALEYDNDLEIRLGKGTAGDLIWCRPFSHYLLSATYLTDLTSEPFMKRYQGPSLAAWTSADGEQFCLPLSTVSHGFFYNVDAFKKLGLTVPQTLGEWLRTLRLIKQDGTYVPIAMGTKSNHRPSLVAMQAIGPTFWGGESGRQAFVAGDVSLIDEPFMRLFEHLASWQEYLPEGAELITNVDAADLFKTGQAIIYPAGSWESLRFTGANFTIGVFGPPRFAADDNCYLIGHPDVGLGLNVNTSQPKAGMTFLEWAAGDEFRQLFADAHPGFLPIAPGTSLKLGKIPGEFARIAGECQLTHRLTYGMTGEGAHQLRTEIPAAIRGVMQGAITPRAAAELLNSALDRATR